MEFGFTKEQEKFRQEILDYFEKEPVGDDLIYLVGLPFSASYNRKLGEKGWVGLWFPKEYGGLGLDVIYEIIFEEEAGRTGAPVGPVFGLTVISIGGFLLSCGSEEFKKEFLPQITRGEIAVIQGFTEPEAGCDLTAIQTRSVREGDYYVINGQKIFSSFSELKPSDKTYKKIYMAVTAITNPDVPQEEGTSLILVDNTIPGVSVTPMSAMAGMSTNLVFLDDVKVPVKNLVGEENRFWDCFARNKFHYWQKTRTIRLGGMQRMLNAVVQYVKATKVNGQPLSQKPWVRSRIAQMAIDIKIIRLFNYRIAWMLSKGLDVEPLTAMLKVFGDEALVRFDNMAMQILGLASQLKGGDYAPLKGMIQFAYQADGLRHFADSGGSSTSRSLVATKALGLPES